MLGLKLIHVSKGNTEVHKKCPGLDFDIYYQPFDMQTMSQYDLSPKKSYSTQCKNYVA